MAAMFHKRFCDAWRWPSFAYAPSRWRPASKPVAPFRNFEVLVPWFLLPTVPGDDLTAPGRTP
jgi:hypothetical protein